MFEDRREKRRKKAEAKKSQKPKRETNRKQKHKGKIKKGKKNREELWKKKFLPSNWRNSLNKEKGTTGSGKNLK